LNRSGLTHPESLQWSPLVPSAFWSVAVNKTSSHLLLIRRRYESILGPFRGLLLILFWYFSSTLKWCKTNVNSTKS
jgi:hypothetical protein